MARLHVVDYLTSSSLDCSFRETWPTQTPILLQRLPLIPLMRAQHPLRRPQPFPLQWIFDITIDCANVTVILAAIVRVLVVNIASASRKKTTITYAARSAVKTVNTNAKGSVARARVTEIWLYASTEQPISLDTESVPRFSPLSSTDTFFQNTNVVELHNRVLKDVPDVPQLTFYSSGIGTYVPPSTLSVAHWLHIFDKAFAW